jgi:hypothetical protein
VKYLLLLLILIAMWTLRSKLSSGVEHAQYSVVKKNSEYEIRDYPAHIEAQTTIQGPHESALNRGFGIVAGYIFGGNTRKQSIAMTAPVLQRKAEFFQSEKIAMTAPVTVSNQGEDQTISFVMPSSYTLESLPTPTDARVRVVEVPAQKIAAVQFSGYRTTARVQSLQKQLMENLSRDNVIAVGQPSYAGYNAPWTPPWLMRNEVLVQIQ